MTMAAKKKAKKKAAKK